MTQIAPEDIQKELDRLWESLPGANKMRASLLNLVVYTKATPRLDYLRDVIKQVVQKFPSRVIFITTEDGQNALKVDVSLMMAGEQEHPIACDFIDIKVSGNYLPRVPLLILPHFLPDLPIYLVWDENPTQENPISQEMEKYASRIIFDSESAQNLQQFAKSLLKHKESYPSLDIADLNWARSEGWRELFADTFHSPERLEVLEKTQKIEIIYNKVETPAFCHTRIQPIYLQGWLSSQLNWKFIKGALEKEKLHFTYESPSGTVDVYLTPMTLSQKASSGMIFDVELISRDQDSFSFKRNRELLHQIDIQIATKDQCELPSQFLFTKGVSGRSLIREIYHRGTSSSFLKLLERLSTLDSSLC